MSLFTASKRFKIRHSRRTCNLVIYEQISRGGPPRWQNSVGPQSTRVGSTDLNLGLVSCQFERGRVMFGAHLGVIERPIISPKLFVRGHSPNNDDHNDVFHFPNSLQAASEPKDQNQPPLRSGHRITACSQAAPVFPEKLQSQV